MGLGIFVAVFCVGPFSGAYINPAVTIGLATAGTFAWSQVPLYIAAQCIGAAIGAGLVWLHYRPHFAVTDDKDAKLGVFCTGPAIDDRSANFISEVMGTLMLVFAVLYLTGPKLDVSGFQLSNETVQPGRGGLGRWTPCPSASSC